MIDLERYKPESWDQICGNQELKEYFWDMIWCVRKEGHRSGFNLLSTGPSRAGKTATISFGVKCLACLDFNFSTMNPCGCCHNCTMNVHLYGNDGWETVTDTLSEELPTPIRLHYLPLDCTRVTSHDLDQILGRIRVSDDSIIRVIYLDEVHRLSRRFMDEQLLKALEEFPAIWIASSACVKKEDTEGPHKLEKMFQNRFTFRLNTQKPTIEELACWLAARCRECGIQCEEPKPTLTRLAERCNQIPGMALQVLNKAHKTRSKILTAALVERHIFDFDD